MATTIVTKFGGDAPAASDIVRGELAVDTENGRLYTENSSGAVVEIGLKPEGNVDVTGTVSAANVSLPDDGVLSLGTSDELTLKHHNSGYSHLINTTGTLYIDSDSVTFRDDDGSPSNMVVSQTGIDVTGSVTADGLTVSASATDFEGVQILNTNTAASPTTASILLGVTNSVRTVNTKIQAIEGGGDANETSLAFFTNTGGNVLTKAMTIDSFQNVGIGTSSVATKLHVMGNSTVRNTIVSTLTLDAGISAANPYTEFGTGIDFKGRDYSNAVRNYGGIYSIMVGNASSTTPAGDAGFNSALTFYTNTGGASGTNPTEKMRIDPTGVGIGGAAATARLEVTGAFAYASGASSLATTVSKAAARIRGSSDASTSLFFGSLTNDAEQYIQSSNGAGNAADDLVLNPYGGKVGIGSIAPFAPLHLKNTSWSSGSPYGTVQLIEGQAVNDHNWSHLVITDADDTNGNGGSISFASGAASSLNPFASIKGYREGSGYGSLDFYTRPSGGTATQRMRITSAGSLLVDKTATGIGTAGIELTHDNVILGTRDGGTAQYLNRLTSDGNVIEFQKNGTTVGSIGTQADDLNIGNADVALRFADNIDSIIPFSQTANADRGGAIDLGYPSDATKFKDLHLSGGVSNVTASGTATSTIISGISGVTNGFQVSANTSNEMTYDFNTGLGLGMRLTNAGILLLSQTVTSGIGGTPADDNGIEIGPGYINLNRDDTADARQIQFGKNGSVVGHITTDGSATSYNTSSDQRLKDNIVDAPSASDDIDAIQVRSFDWKADGSHQKYGMVAQELQTVAPEAVSAPEDPEEMMGVDYSKLVPMMLKEIQSLRARVAQLES